MRRIVPALMLVLLVIAAGTGYWMVTKRLSAASEAAGSQSTAYPVPLMTAKSSIPKVAVIGDSYAAGAGASDDAHQFINILAKKRGWSVTSFARGGTGYSQSIDRPDEAQRACGLDQCVNYSAQIRSVATAKPDIVFVWGGRNDSQTDPPAESRAILKFYRDLRLAIPNTQVYAALPVWGADTPPASIQAIANDVLLAASQTGVSVISLGQPFRGRPDLMSTDGVHPNDNGHAVLAASLAEKLIRSEALR